MKTLTVIHPKTGLKINATIYCHETTESAAKLIASKIDGGFVKRNNKTELITVFYPSTNYDLSNRF